MDSDIVVTPVSVLQSLLRHSLDVHKSLVTSLRAHDTPASVRAFEELSATLTDLRDGINTHRQAQAQVEVLNLLRAQSEVVESLRRALQN